MALIALSAPGRAQTRQTYFEYPLVPDSLETLQKRCDYLLDHFWDFCDLKKAFSSKSRMKEAFTDYLSFMPMASADMVYSSIDRLAKKLEKQPDDLLFLVQEAENQVMGDTCQYYSEQVYLQFAKAALANKRVDKTTKLRFQQQVQQLGSTQPGMTAPDLHYTDRAGQPRSLAADSATLLVVYFNDPDCSECRMARVQLDANIQATKLIDMGIMKVICLTPSEYSPEWAESVSVYPEKWTVGAAPEADMVYHILEYPSFYILDNQHKIHAKNYNIDQMLEVISRMEQRVSH